jgi:hypothetical protein
LKCISSVMSGQLSKVPIGGSVIVTAQKLVVIV